MTSKTKPLVSAVPRGCPEGRLSRAQNFMGQFFQKQKLDFLGLFYWAELCLSKLNKMLNQCLNLSPLTNHFAVFKARKHLCYVFNYILS